MDLTGAQVRGVLEEGAASRYGVVQVSGLRWAFDVDAPFGNRVTRITLPDGTPIDPSSVGLDPELYGDGVDHLLLQDLTVWPLGAQKGCGSMVARNSQMGPSRPTRSRPAPRRVAEAFTCSIKSTRSPRSRAAIASVSRKCSPRALS